MSHLKKKKNSGGSAILGGRKALIFYIVLMAIPILQFCIFYVGVNFNSFLIAFQKTDILTGVKTATFEHFERFWREMTVFTNMRTVTLNSIKAWAISLCISMPLSLIISFYIYKKAFGSGFFKVLVFAPSIISSMVLVLMFKYFVEWGLPMAGIVTSSGTDFITDINTRFETIVFYNIWIGLGSSMLVYSGAMSQIDDSVVEAAQLDGAGLFSEFVYITLPSVYPTLSVFLVTGIAGLFNNQLCLYNFYGPLCEQNYQTVGYYIFVNVSNGTVNDQAYAAAIGLVGTGIIIPITLILRWALDKFGPQEE